MDDAKNVLLHLGFDRVRGRGGDWHPTTGLNGELGTTDDTYIYLEGDKARLVDPDTGEDVGFARPAAG